VPLREHFLGIGILHTYFLSQASNVLHSMAVLKFTLLLLLAVSSQVLALPVNQTEPTKS
jgi:hypothetical protein